MENISEPLDIKLLTQSFDALPGQVLQLDSARLIARLYTSMENGIGVLGDMKTRKSYLYYGAIADKLGLRRKETVINSNWEDELLGLIHSEDLQKNTGLNFVSFNS